MYAAEVSDTTMMTIAVLADLKKKKLRTNF